MINNILIDASYACKDSLDKTREISLASVIDAMEFNIFGVDSIELTPSLPTDFGVGGVYGEKGVRITLNDDNNGWDWAVVTSSMDEVEGYLRFRYPHCF